MFQIVMFILMVLALQRQHKGPDGDFRSILSIFHIWVSLTTKHYDSSLNSATCDSSGWYIFGRKVGKQQKQN